MQASNQAITYGRHIRALAILGIPIIVGQLGTIIQGLADTIMVGHFSAHSLAAAGFVNNIMVLVLIFALGYSYAITPVIGPMHARGEFENAGKALKAGLQVNGALGMVLFLLMGILYFFLGHMGQPEELLPEIRPYYIVVVLSIPIQSLFNAFKQFFDSIGNTRTPMWIMISANLFNIVGNYLLIYGIGPFPQLGLLGAGISTTLSRILMLVVIYGIFISNERVPAMTWATFRPRFLATMAQLMVAVMSSTTSTTWAGCPLSSSSKASIMEAATREWSRPLMPK